MFWGGRCRVGIPRGEAPHSGARLRPFPREVARSGFDVGLAPLLDDVFHRSKTNNKYREYGACRIAGVYSDVSVYASCVRHGETGLLVPSRPGAWFEAVARLVEEPGARERIQQQAREDVRSRHSQDETEAVWLEEIERVWADRERSSRPLPSQAAGQPVPRGGMRVRERLVRLGGRLRQTGPRATLAGIVWYVHGLRTMRRLRRELSSD